MERRGYIGWTRLNSDFNDSRGNPLLLQTAHYFGGAAVGGIVGLALWVTGAEPPGAVWKGVLIGLVGGALVGSAMTVEAGLYRWRARRHRRRHL